jgi:hypothetical protein
MDVDVETSIEIARPRAQVAAFAADPTTSTAGTATSSGWSG